jgi:predicted nucleotidyltransferase
MMLGWDALTPAQIAVAQPFLAARSGERRHVVAYLSGAHAYGFPSPDSDLDIKCVHVAPTRMLVGLAGKGDLGADVLTVIDGVEVDYGSNEIGMVLRGALKGNGNFLERLLGAMTLVEDPLLAPLRPLVRDVLCRRVVHHYGGFARSQKKAALAKPTAKKVLYVLRTALTGVHLLRTGEMDTDLGRLAGIYPVPGVDELIATKRRGEQVPLSADELSRWLAELDRTLALLGQSVDGSILPPDPPLAAAAALDDWLIELRRTSF